MKKRNYILIGIAVVLIAVIGLAVHSVWMFGPSADAIATDIDKIGIENLKREADILFQSGSEGITKNEFPEHMGELNPDCLISNSDAIVVVLQKFNGFAETGIYIYRNKSVPKRKYEEKQIDDRVSVYRMID